MHKFQLWRIALSFALTIPCCAPLAGAQAPQAASSQITIAVDAFSAKGDAVRGLTAADFKLLDNKADKPITALKEVTPAQEPVSLFIVVDAVNIDFSRVAFVRSEILKFLASNGGKLAHPATLVVLEDKSTQIQQGFTTDGKVLADELTKYPFGLREIRRDTGIWGADERTQISLRALQQLGTYAATLPGRKLVMWVSPGWPLLTGAHIELDQRQQDQTFSDIVALSTQLRVAKITLDDINPLGPGENLVMSTYYQDFTKGVRKPGDVELADLSLQVLAAQSGGRVFTSDSDVAGNLARSATDGDGWYDVTFESAHAERANEYHHIEVDVAKPGTKVRTRDGYYAQP